jgi:hypothetical protein
MRTLANGNLQLDADTRGELGKLLAREFVNADEASNTLQTNWATWRDQYNGVKATNSAKQPWQARYSMPETKQAINTAAVQIAGVAVSADPYFELEAEDPEFDEVAHNEESYQQMWHERTRFKAKVAIAICEALTVGTCWLKPGVKRTGRTLPAEITGPLKLSELDAEPTCDYIVAEDAILLPMDAPNFQMARGAFGKTILRWNDFVLAKKDGIFYDDVFDRIENRWMEEHASSVTATEQGIDRETPIDMWQAEFVCWEGIYRYVKPGDETETEVLMLVAYNPDSSGEAIILRCTDYEPLFDKQWFFVPIICDPKPNSMWGHSMCEDMADIQRWMDATFEQSTDAVAMAILPPIVVQPGSDVVRKKLKWAPAAIWPLANPATAVNMLGVNPTTLTAVNLAMGQMDMMSQKGQRITGTGDTLAGVQTQGDKTKFEIGAVVENANQIFEHKLSNVQIGLEDDQGLVAYAQLCLRIHQTFMPNVPIQYRIGGNEPYQTVDPAWHEGKYRVTANGTTASHNPQLRLQRAMAIKQLADADPFLGFSPIDTPETVFETVKRLYSVRRDVLQAMGVRHTESYIGGEPKDVQEAIRIAAIFNPQAIQIMAARWQAQQNPQLGAGTGLAQPVAEGQSGPVAGSGPPGGTEGGGGPVGGGQPIPGPGIEAGMGQIPV